MVAHFSWHPVTHAGKTAGLVGHPLMHSLRQLGDGDGESVVVFAGQSDWHTPTQMSCALPVTTEQAFTQAPIDPPGQTGVGVGVGDGAGDGAGGEGCGVGAGAGGNGGGAGAVAKIFFHSI